MFLSLELCHKDLTCRIHPLGQALTLLLSWPTLLQHTHLGPGVAAPLLALPRKARQASWDEAQHFFVFFHNPGSHDFTIRHVTMQAMTAMASHFLIAMATIL